MAALALEKIQQCSEANSLDVRIYVDVCDEDRITEFEYVRDQYFPTASIFHARTHPLAPSGCWNILSALKAGYETGAEYIFLIEEDVMVYPDYFSWNFSQTGDHFATCGRLVEAHSSDYYTNPGACFKSSNLRRVVPHINDNYFASRRQYLDEHFGIMEEASDLDDGMIRRVIRFVNGHVLYPPTPKVAHQGFHYYNRMSEYKTTGRIQDRIQSLREMVEILSPTDRYTKDFEQYHPTV